MSPCGPLSALWGGQHHWPSQTRGMLELREVRRQAGPLALQTWVLPRPFSGLCPMHTSSHWMSGGPRPQPSQQALGPAYSTSNVLPHPTATVSLVPADVITRLVSPLAANCRLGPCWPPHVGAVSVAPFPHTHFLPSCTPPFESTSKLCPCPRAPLHRHTHLSPSVPALRLLCIAMPTSAHVSLPSRSSALPCPPRPRQCLCVFDDHDDVLTGPQTRISPLLVQEGSASEATPCYAVPLQLFMAPAALGLKFSLPADQPFPTPTASTEPAFAPQCLGPNGWYWARG